MLRNFYNIFFAKHSTAHKYMPKTWIPDVNFLINYGIPFRFLEQKIYFIFYTFVSLFIFFRQSHHEITNKIISGVLLFIENIAN